MQVGLVSAAHPTTHAIYAGTDTAQYPADVVVDRCIVEGQAGKNCSRLMRPNGIRTAVINTWMDFCIAAPSTGFSDGQAILISGGPGPHKIDHNVMRVGARGEHILFGGGSNGIVPEDIQVTRNLFDFPLAWHSTYDVKNMYENKIGHRVLIQGNRFSNYKSTGVGSQYFAIVLKSVDQTHGSYPNSQTTNVTFRMNEFVNNGGGLASFHRLPESFGTPSERFEWTCNRTIVPTSDWTGVPRDWCIQLDRMTGVRIHHNSFYNSIRQQSGDFIFFSPSGPTLADLDSHSITDNILAMNPAIQATGWIGANAKSPGMPSWTGIQTTGVFSGNAVTKSTTVPSGNTTAASIVAAELNASTLALSGTSPFLGTATDGRDPGPVHALITAAMAEVPS
jgi:hypothetical protein